MRQPDITKRGKNLAPLRGKGRKWCYQFPMRIGVMEMPWSRKDSQESRKEIPLPLSVIALWGAGSSHRPNSTEKVTSYRGGPFRTRSRGEHGQKYIQGRGQGGTDGE